VKPHDPHAAAEVLGAAAAGRAASAPLPGVEVDPISAFQAGHARALLGDRAHHLLAGHPRQHEIAVPDPDQLEIGAAHARHRHLDEHLAALRRPYRQPLPTEIAHLGHLNTVHFH
jgi:hypothetical protein